MTIRLPQFLTLNERSSLQSAADVCPVKLSLHPEIEVEMRFVYGDQSAAAV